MTERIDVRELVAWGLDENEFRPNTDTLPREIDRARRQIAKRESLIFEDAILANVPRALAGSIERVLKRFDLQEEMKGLDWTIGVVDLRRLHAFQRRLILNGRRPYLEIPDADNWPALFEFAFPPAAPVEYRRLASSGSELVLQSENPNFQVRTSATCDRHPIQLHGGSPFFEVAEFRGRWFLRDGYHRAYRLLRGNVQYLPAVIVRARTLAELGPVYPWFFSEETLFGSAPPCVTDFLDDSLTINYVRPRLLKTLRVIIEENLVAATPTAIQGEPQ